MSKEVLLDEILTIDRDGLERQLKSNIYCKNSFQLKCEMNSIQLSVCFEVQGPDVENISCQIRLEFLEPHTFVDGHEKHLWQDYTGCPHGKIEFHADLLHLPLRIIQSDDEERRFVECHVIIRLNSKSNSPDPGNFTLNLPQHTADNFSRFYNDPAFCDLEIRVGTQKFMVNRFVISMRSPKFEATLRSNPNKNYMRLEGVEADIFELILRHIYGAEVEMNDYHQVGRLLAASCSLQIDGLVKKCEDHLCQSVGMHSIVELLQMARKLNLKKLKRQTIQFVDQTFSRFINTPEWLQLLDDKQLATEVCGSIAKGDY